ncbi:hypothetical protein [Burkholderia gladioli]|uniref:hypothetical protein n=1 Tax=Burkholderia gladioli TaxID=28095 RepID=UPI0016403B70|nr:hypothetical protein [Burkholderia gladioli]
MSESKQQWTPGPWSIDWNITRLDIHANGKLVATLRRSTKDGAPTYDDKEAIANANLISAAPELVEALSRTLQLLTDMGAPEEPEDAEVLEAARAALAKAGA